MAQVAPSILSADLANLANDCRRVLGNESNILHFDVMDGIFVPNLSFGLPVLASLKKALPGVCYDVHLMIQHPHLYAERFVEAGADIVTFHIEAESPIEETAKAICAKGAKSGLSLRPGTPVEKIFPYLPFLDLVLVMSVEPGFGGQSFIPEAPGRIAALRAEANRLGIPLLLEVDGGINETTGALCVDAGVDILVAGSSVFGAADPVQAVRTMQSLT